MKRILMVMAVALVSAVVFTSCQSDESKETYDYSVESNWMVKDFQGKDVDVFYVYPTIIWKGYTDAADLNEEERGNAYRTYLSQAYCLAENANMFAPFFRQGTMEYLLPLDNSDIMMDVVRGSIGKEDLFAALDYYFENLNGGRPFIIASHSQGTAMMRTVFEEYVNKDETHKNYFKRMIAAYMLGFSVPKTWMAEVGVKGAERADDTGVIIAYNTEGPGATKPSIPVTSDDFEINPLTWSTDTLQADASLNKGCFVWDDRATNQYHIQTPGECDAKIDYNRAAVVCTTVTNYVNLPDDPFGDKSLHGYDWAGYYLNLRENAKTRIDAYFAEHK